MTQRTTLWDEAIEAAAEAVAQTRYYEGDGHMDAGKMLAMAEKNVRSLPRRTSGMIPLAVPINTEELACRIFETGVQIKRPPGLTPSEALATMPPEDSAAWLRAAELAVDFVLQAMATANNGSVIRPAEGPAQ